MGKCSKASKAYYQERFISNLHKAMPSEESVYSAATCSTMDFDFVDGEFTLTGGDTFDHHSFDDIWSYVSSMRKAEAKGERSDVWNSKTGIEVKHRPKSTAIYPENYPSEIGDKVRGYEIKICVYYGPDIGKVPTLCDQDGVALFWFESGTPEDNWLSLVFQLKLHWGLINYAKSHVLVSDEVEVHDEPKNHYKIIYQPSERLASLSPVLPASSPAFVSKEVFHGKGPPDSTPNLSVSNTYISFNLIGIGKRIGKIKMNTWYWNEILGEGVKEEEVTSYGTCRMSKL